MTAADVTSMVWNSNPLEGKLGVSLGGKCLFFCPFQYEPFIRSSFQGHRWLGHGRVRQRDEAETQRSTHLRVLGYVKPRSWTGHQGEPPTSPSDPNRSQLPVRKLGPPTGSRTQTTVRGHGVSLLFSPGGSPPDRRTVEEDGPSLPVRWTQTLSRYDLALRVVQPVVQSVGTPGRVPSGVVFGVQDETSLWTSRTQGRDREKRRGLGEEVVGTLGVWGGSVVRKEDQESLKG